MTNRNFLSVLTRAQLLALAVQHLSLRLDSASECSDEELRDMLETLPQAIQNGVPA